MKAYYFDNSATTPMLPEVLNVTLEAMENHFANASSTYGIGRKAKAEIELIRKNIAKQIGALDSEIIFTSGGTEANNLILQSAVESIGVQRIITSKIEHHAVLKTIEFLQKQAKITVDYLEFTEKGEIDIDSLNRILPLSHVKTLVSLMHINNETGVILDVEKVGTICEKHQVLFHTDTVQSIGHFPIDFSSFKVHFATASAHKFHGPKGIGFAYIKKSAKIKALQYGGEQERGLRAGTEAVPLIIGMGKAIEIAYKNLTADQKYIQSIKEYAAKELSKIKGVAFNANSDQPSRNYNLLSVRLPITSEKASTILFQLDLQGICCSRGSACQSGSNKPSHVLEAILPNTALNYTSLRFSFSKLNTKAEVDYLVEQLKRVVNRFKK